MLLFECGRCAMKLTPTDVLLGKALASDTHISSKRSAVNLTLQDQSVKPMKNLLAMLCAIEANRVRQKARRAPSVLLRRFAHIQEEGAPMFFYEPLSATAFVSVVIYLAFLIGMNELSRLNK